LRQQAEENIQAIALEKDWELLALEEQPDHIHLLVSAPPTVAPTEIGKVVKGISARRAVSYEIMKRYIEECKSIRREAKP